MCFPTFKALFLLGIAASFSSLYCRGQFPVTVAGGGGHLKEPLFYVVVDNRYSEKSIEAVKEAVFRMNQDNTYRTTRRLQIVKVKRAGEYLLWNKDKPTAAWVELSQLTCFI
jgi:hypothetical protein